MSQWTWTNILVWQSHYYFYSFNIFYSRNYTMNPNLSKSKLNFYFLSEKYKDFRFLNCISSLSLPVEYIDVNYFNSCFVLNLIQSYYCCFIWCLFIVTYVSFSVLSISSTCSLFVLTWSISFRLFFRGVCWWQTLFLFVGRCLHFNFILERWFYWV